ncbi:MAG: thrombospondin type 3 repeat-containing protein [Actinomycetota bacterium]|nr:thrombospondin type 3 repeat-containing protein [Actinomycetota bacterium]
MPWPLRAAFTIAITAAALLATVANSSAAVVISEFKTGGSGGVTDEFVELLNKGPGTAQLGGTELVRKPTAAGVPCTVMRLPNTLNLQPGQRYLGTGTGYTGGPAGNQALSSSVSPCTGSDKLPADKSQLDLNTPATASEDVVAYGGNSTDFPPSGAHGGTIAAPPSGSSAERLSFGSRDTDNPADWTIRGTPQPQNSSFVDPDLDGVSPDNCPNTSNPDQANADGDGQGDVCDSDDDNDGAPDASDNCKGTVSTDQTDTDGDGQGNPCDADDDNDGVPDANDDFPTDPTKSSATADGDGDGVPDVSDGCPAVPGPASNGGCPVGATDANDVLTGTDAGETICGLLGSDTINGLGGADTLFGDVCNDTTKLLAGAQLATEGGDTIDGGDGDDTIFGAGGNDKLNGGNGNDSAFGGDGNDSVKGGDGNDRLDGGRGNDKLSGGKGKNKYAAGSGNDAVSARNSVKENIDCGKGSKDTATVDRSDKVKNCETVRRPRRK